MTTPPIRTVVLEREFTAPPEKIWRALTQPHLLEEWLMQTDFEPVEGRKFTLRNQPRPDVSVVIDCQVRTIEPHKTLSYSWDAFGLESVVTFTLEPTASGTRLRMEQTGFRPDQDLAFKGAQAAWKQFAARLDVLLTRLD
ncbi:SRPBCC domain-containing protein [Devosia sp. ZW T5_3]|uniref:SRPBCC family protein n=1 Tax=Devosia sp. ZW T5_3 TaxID=3378085 RepID=UPI003852015F